jgi:hypothetical protein
MIGPRNQRKATSPQGRVVPDRAVPAPARVMAGYRLVPLWRVLALGLLSRTRFASALAKGIRVEVR